ncbi:hypothetical protein BJ742DRAFT_854957 [Cladochytrium replicatum]|nr:hypothetical protein BJ742DRAFT_854957 [Cladochytrium replicatum]
MPPRYKPRKMMNSGAGDSYSGKMAVATGPYVYSGSGGVAGSPGGSSSVSSERSASVTRRSQTPQLQQSGAGYSKHNNSSRNQPDSSSMQRGRPGKQKAPKLAGEPSRRKENDQQLIDYELGREYGAPSPTARNKQGAISLNHLLNFYFPPRRQGQSSSSKASRRKSSYHEPFNKERFVNANFRFVMSEDGDYSINLGDPDVIVDWDKIVQVIDVTSKQPSCPICLSQPVVSARVTKCGHVYCTPCILHYLALGDRKWRKCPICYDAIYARDLKRAGFVSVEEQKSGSGQDWVLMKRAMDSTVSLPRMFYDLWADKSSSRNPPTYSFPTASVYSKLMISSPEHKLEMLLQDRDSLQTALVIATEEEEIMAAAVKKRTVVVGTVGAPNWAGPVGYGMPTMPAAAASEPEQTGGEKVFVEMALKNVEEEIESLLRLYKNLKSYESTRTPVASSPADIPAVLSSSHQSRTSYEPSERESSSYPRPLEDNYSDFQHSDSDYHPFQFDSDVGPDSESVRSAQFGTPPIPPSHAPPIAAATPVNVPPADGFYYFYRCADGQHMYMHPMDIKILKHKYGSYDRFPDVLHIEKVLSVRESTVTEDLRKRCKYLGHLPLSCDVAFCELDLKGIVSEETLAVFEKELSQRERRLQKQLDDDARSKKAVTRDTESPSSRQRGRRQRRQSTSSLVDSDRDDASDNEHFEEEWPLAVRLGASPATMAAIFTSLDDDGGVGLATTPPSESSAPIPGSGKSFASMAGSGSGSGWARRVVSRDGEDEDGEEEGGWKLEIDAAALMDAGVAGKGEGARKSKGKKKNVVLVSNGGRRGRI